MKKEFTIILGFILVCTLSYFIAVNDAAWGSMTHTWKKESEPLFHHKSLYNLFGNKTIRHQVGTSANDEKFGVTETEIQDVIKNQQASISENQQTDIDKNHQLNTSKSVIQNSSKYSGIHGIKTNQFSSYQNLSNEHNSSEAQSEQFKPDEARISERLHTDTDKGRKTVVLLLTTKRSGSSFLGELFNQNPSAFYLFEPLFPFTRDCTLMQRERIDTLRKLVRCNFDDMRSAHRYAFNRTNHTDQFAQCGANHVCFLHRTKHLTREQSSTADKLNRRCRESSVVVYKLLRLCSLQQTIERFSDVMREVDLKIIHLVRDPRAIISSRAMLIPQKANVTEEKRHLIEDVSRILCEKIENNLDFADRFWQDPQVNSKQYIRVRHEDITQEPEMYARFLYEFVGVQLPLPLIKFFEETRMKARNNSADIRKPFSNVRKSLDVLNGWRHRLQMAEVWKIQTRCTNLMHKLNYKFVNNIQQLHSENIVLW